MPFTFVKGPITDPSNFGGPVLAPNYFFSIKELGIALKVSVTHDKKKNERLKTYQFSYFSYRSSCAEGSLVGEKGAHRLQVPLEFSPPSTRFLLV